MPGGPVQADLDTIEGSKALLGRTNQLSLLVQRRHRELDGLQPCPTEVCEVRCNAHFAHEATGVQVAAEDQECPARQYVVACTESQQTVSKGDPFGPLRPVHGGAADKNVTRLQAVLTEDPGEVHLLNTSRIDAVFKVILDTRRKGRIRGLVPAGWRGRPSSTSPTSATVAHAHPSGSFPRPTPPMSSTLLALTHPVPCPTRPPAHPAATGCL